MVREAAAHSTKSMVWEAANFCKKRTLAQPDVASPNMCANHELCHTPLNGLAQPDVAGPNMANSVVKPRTAQHAATLTSVLP
jgi:hypothetical protein